MLCKNGVHLADDGVKELVIICDQVHFSSKNKWTSECFQSPGGAEAKYTTLIQEMNGE